MADQIKLELVGALKLPALSGGLRKELSALVREAAAGIEAHAKEAIEGGPKTGRVYRGEQEVTFTTGDGEEVSFTAYRGQAGHQASAPGEAPATDEGNLVGSISMRVINDLEAEVTVSAEYAAVLEFGGKNVAARPFLKPAVEEIGPLFLADCEAAVQRTLG